MSSLPGPRLFGILAAAAPALIAVVACTATSGSRPDGPSRQSADSMRGSIGLQDGREEDAASEPDDDRAIPGGEILEGDSPGDLNPNSWPEIQLGPRVLASLQETLRGSGNGSLVVAAERDAHPVDAHLCIDARGAITRPARVRMIPGSEPPAKIADVVEVSEALRLWTFPVNEHPELAETCTVIYFTRKQRP